MGREGAHLLDLDAELAELIGGGVDGGGDLWWWRRHAHRRARTAFFVFFLWQLQKGQPPQNAFSWVWQFAFVPPDGRLTLTGTKRWQSGSNGRHSRWGASRVRGGA